MRDNVTPISAAPSLRGPEHETDEALYSYALRSLGSRAMSSGALFDKLRVKDASEHEAQAVVDRVIAEGYLDDHRFATLRIQKLREQGGYGDRAIRQRLMTAGVPVGVIDEALSDLVVDDPMPLVLETARARAGRLAGLDRATAERRLSSYLQRRGHAGGVIREAVRQALDEVEEHRSC